MLDKNGKELKSEQKVLTPWGTGFVRHAYKSTVILELDGGGVQMIDDSKWVEVVT